MPPGAQQAASDRNLRQELHPFNHSHPLFVVSSRQHRRERPARHAEYARYNVYIMFRHLAMHDMLHLYRMEELLLDPSFFS